MTFKFPCSICPIHLTNHVDDCEIGCKDVYSIHIVCGTKNDYSCTVCQICDLPFLESNNRYLEYARKWINQCIPKWSQSMRLSLYTVVNLYKQVPSTYEHDNHKLNPWLNDIVSSSFMFNINLLLQVTLHQYALEVQVSRAHLSSSYIPC